MWAYKDKTWAQRVPIEKTLENGLKSVRARLTTAKATIFLEKQYQIARIPKEASNPNIPPIAAMTELLPKIP